MDPSSPFNLNESYIDNVNTSALEDLPGYDSCKERLKNRLEEKRESLSKSKESNAEPDLSVVLVVSF